MNLALLGLLMLTAASPSQPQANEVQQPFVSRSAWRRAQEVGQLPPPPVPPPIPMSMNCNDTAFQGLILSAVFAGFGGPFWTVTTNWNTSKLCMLNGKERPSHCCWYGVSCCLTPRPCAPNATDRSTCDCTHENMVTQLRLSRNNLTGQLGTPLPAVLGIGCELNTLDFSFNKLNGSISDPISNFTSLKTLSLASNNFSGTLPSTLRNLPRLQVLDLTNNNMSGTIPIDLCNLDSNSSLTDLLLANNNFEGEYRISQCNNLVALDVTRNNLNGSLPSFRGYESLHIAHMGRNNFSGQIPSDVDSSPLLMDFDVSQNSLTGTIPYQLSNLRLLSYLRLGDNDIAGTIPPKLFANLGSLVRMALANNQLTGTIPPVDPNLGTVVLMDLSNNSLIGTIPETFKTFAEPSVAVLLQLNLLSCCGINPVDGATALKTGLTSEAYGGINYTLATNPETLLPSFLSFSNYLIPVPPGRNGNTTNMRCPDVVAKGDSPDEASIRWSLDPSYYLHHRCECDAGYQLANLSQPGKLWHFQCEPTHDPWYVEHPWILAVVVVGATLIIIALLFLVCYRKGAKPAILQQYMNMLKRLKGEPSDGVVTIVTTDIEGYSDLMKREPELMGKGLRIHNYCIDKARWQFFGYTMEQEGDSFILAFYDPFDAVAFCLQAQLLLQRVEWPEKLLNPEGGAERTRKGSILTQALSRVGRMLTRDRMSDRDRPMESPASRGGAGSNESSGTMAGDPPPSGGSRNFRMWLSGRQHNQGAIPEEHPVGAAPSSMEMRQQDSSAPSTMTMGGISPMSSQGPSAANISPQYSLAYTAAPSSSALPGGQGGLSPGGPQQGGTYSLASAGQNSNAFSNPQNSLASETTGMTVRPTPRPNVFNGLRVRMGVTTGKLGKGVTVRSSPIMESSKVVSDAAAGGQILLDNQTFHEVKARLVELGAVDHNGLSVDKMNLSKPTLLSYMCGRGRNRGTDEAEIAVVLDMGQYIHSQATQGTGSLNNTLLNTQPGGIVPSNYSRSLSTAKNLEPPTAKSQGSADAEQISGAMDGSAHRMHLYQIVSPALVERAHHFGSKLALKDDWICVDQPYFNAPGAAAAALGLDASSVIPAITMVFCMVDGAKDWKPLHDKSKRLPVQRIMRGVLVNTLMTVRGGYMCRMQEDEFKYMAAFPTPEEAAKWCLIVQDALMWQDWPEWLLKLEKARTERDARGNVVFRGPRLRMGLCHGTPQAIVPDHMGRADYHGASINSAARYMDATAHGGQVVCELATAMSMINRWNGKSSFTSSLGIPTPVLSLPSSLPSAVTYDAASSNQFEPVRPQGGEITPLEEAFEPGPEHRVYPAGDAEVRSNSTMQLALERLEEDESEETSTPSASGPASVRYGSFGQRLRAPGSITGLGPGPVRVSSAPPVTYAISGFSAPMPAPVIPRSDAARAHHRELVSISSVDLAAALHENGEEPGSWRPNLLMASGLTTGWDELSLRASGLPKASDSSEHDSRDPGSRDPGSRDPGRSGTGTARSRPYSKSTSTENPSIPPASPSSAVPPTITSSPSPNRRSLELMVPSLDPSGGSAPSLLDPFNLRRQRPPSPSPGAPSSFRGQPLSGAYTGPSTPRTSAGAYPGRSNLSSSAQPLSNAFAGSRAPPLALTGLASLRAHPSFHASSGPSGLRAQSSTFAPMSPSMLRVQTSNSAPLGPPLRLTASGAQASNLPPGLPLHTRRSVPDAPSPRATLPALRVPSDGGPIKPFSPLVASTEIRRSGSSGRAGPQGGAGTGVRVTVPTLSGTGEEAARTSAANAAAAGLMNLPSHGTGAMTYRTSVTALRLGGYMFKGNPEEVAMVQLLLESHLERRFPDDPPRGKGGRTSIASGLAGVAPNVEMPNIARRYYFAWCSKNAAPPMPVGPNVKGWAVNILTMAPRSQSQTRPHALQRPADLRAGAQSTVYTGRGSIRSQLLGLVGIGSTAPSQAGAQRSDITPELRRPNSDGGVLMPNELRADSAPAVVSQDESGPLGPPLILPAVAGSRPSNEVAGTSRQLDANSGGNNSAGNGSGVSAMRSDSISSFVEAAKRGLLAAQQQQEQEQAELEGSDMV